MAAIAETAAPKTNCNLTTSYPGQRVVQAVRQMSNYFAGGAIRENRLA
jgi:hypothetical protein